MRGPALNRARILLTRTRILEGLANGLRTSGELSRQLGLGSSHVRALLYRLKAEGLVASSGQQLTKRRGRPSHLWKLVTTIDPRQARLFGGTVNPVDLVTRITGLDDAQRKVLTAIAERARSDVELISATGLKARHLREVLAPLERRKLVEAIGSVAQRRDAVRTWGLGQGFMQQAGAPTAPWSPDVQP